MKNRKRATGIAAAVQAGVWLLGLAILAWTNAWWPGILILVALSVILEAVWPNSAALEAPAETPVVSKPPAAPDPARPAPAPDPVPAPREDLLPAVCPKCGGPVAGSDVRWRGTKAAECPFCGATLPLREA